MTVDAFRLKNFMAFRDTGWIELRAITLLFGRNSSGKSAIIRALRLLKQSLYNGQDNEVLRFAVEGQLDLGDFQAALHRRPDPDDEVEAMEGRKISFAFRGDLLGNEITPVRQHINHYLAANNRELLTDIEVGPIDFELEFGFSETEQGVQLVGVHIDCSWEKLIQIGKTNFVSVSRISQRRDLGREWESHWYWESAFALDERISQEGFPWETVNIELISGFMPILDTALSQFEQRALTLRESVYEMLRQSLKEINRSIENFLNQIEYLGPLRPEPERTYMLNRNRTKYWQNQGWRSWLEALREGSPEPPPDMSKVSLENFPETELSTWMRELGLGLRLYIRGFKDIPESELAAQVFILRKNKQWVNLLDVGFGASQVLPIITACLRATPGSLILIEQPELHLHPSAQAELGNLFVESEKRGIRFLIETHSEHLLLRIRRRLARTALNLLKIERRLPLLVEKDDQPHLKILTNQIRVDYIEDDVDIGFSTANLILLNEEGEYIQRPAGFKTFFSDDFEEVLKINKDIAQVKKLESEYKTEEDVANEGDS